MSRRELLGLGAIGIAEVAGCIGNVVDQSSGSATLFLTSDRCGASSQGSDNETESQTAGRTDGNRFLCRGRPIEDFESAAIFRELDGWEVWGKGDVALTEKTAAVGSQSVDMKVGRSDERCGIVRRFDHGVDLSEYDLSLAVRLEEPETEEGVIVQYRAPNRDNLVQSVRYCRNAGWLRLDHGPTEVRGTPDLTDVRELRIGMYRGTGATGRLGVDSVRATRRRDHGAVVFTFDDNHITQYEKAFPLLQEFGYPGAVAVIPWIVDEDDRIGVDQLAEMHDAGWEMLSHPGQDVSLTGMTRTEMRRSIVESKRWLRDHGFESGARFIAWPLGAYDEQSLAVAHEHHELGFSTATSPVGRITDPLLVPRVNAGNPENAKRMVDLAERFNQVCVLMYHQISRRERDIHCTESELRETLKHVDSADVDIFSVADLHEGLSSG